MELNILRNFLTVARESNITRAAEYLHMTQPTLSKQIKQLEDELGKKLFIRKSYSIELTDEGMLLRKRAEDIIAMIDKVTAEFKAMDEVTGGDIYIGCAESYQIRYLARSIRHFKESYPDFRYHITSGDTEQVTEKLDKGVLDFAIIVEEPDTNKYNYIEVPATDIWGVVMPRTSPLANKAGITVDDLIGLPLFCSEQAVRYDLVKWCGKRVQELKFEGSFRLAYNGSVFAKEGLGYLLTYDKLVDTSSESSLIFRPLEPKLETKIYIIWKQYHMFTPIAQRFLQELQHIGL